MVICLLHLIFPSLMKTRYSILILTAGLCGLQPVSADTIILKDGDSLTGRVLREEGDSYVVEVQVTKSIRDERVIAKDQVKSVEKEKPDLKAYAEIAEFGKHTAPLEPAVYEERIAKIEEFIKKYRNSERLPEAKALLDTLQEEYAVIKEGGVKVGGEMIGAEDYEANAYEYDLKIAEKEIKDAIARRDFLGALRLYAGYDKNFGAAADGREQIDTLILQVLTAYGQSINESLNTLEKRIEKRTAGLERMSPENRAQTQRALHEESEKMDARFAAEKEAGETWVTPDAYHLASLEAAKTQISAATSGIQSKQPAAAEKAPSEVYRDTWKQVQAGADQEKSAAIDAARSAMLPEPYIERLTKAADLPAR